MQVKTALRGQRIDGETRRALRQTLPTLATTVEELCPAVLEVTPTGLVSAYGPFLGGQQRAGRHVFIFATNEGHGLVLAAEWPPREALDEIAAAAHTRTFYWAAICEAVLEEKAGSALLTAAYLFGEAGRSQIATGSSKLRAAGLLPVVCVAAARHKKRARACGMSCVIALPPPIDLFVATPKGAA